VGFDQYIDGHTIRAQVIMERQLHKGAFLILEGTNDYRTLCTFIDRSKCNAVIAYGKNNALAATHLLTAEGLDCIVCVVDADFDRIVGVDNADKHIAITDMHDMDVTIFSTSALDTFLDQVADVAKLSNIVQTTRKSIREILLKSIEPLSRLRLINHSHSLYLDFKGLSFAFINLATLHCDQNALIDEVIANSPAARCSRSELQRLLASDISTQYDLMQL